MARPAGEGPERHDITTMATVPSGMKIVMTSNGEVLEFTDPNAVPLATFVANHTLGVKTPAPQFKFQVLLEGRARSLPFLFRMDEERILPSCDRKSDYAPSFAVPALEWNDAFEFLKEKAKETILSNKPIIYSVQDKGWKPHTALYAVEHYVRYTHPGVFDVAKMEVGGKEKLDTYTPEMWDKFLEMLREKLDEEEAKLYKPCIRNGIVYATLMNYTNNGPSTWSGSQSTQAKCKMLELDNTTVKNITSDELVDMLSHGVNAGGKPQTSMGAILKIAPKHVYHSKSMISDMYEIVEIFVRNLDDDAQEDAPTFRVQQKTHKATPIPKDETPSHTPEAAKAVAVKTAKEEEPAVKEDEPAKKEEEPAKKKDEPVPQLVPSQDEEEAEADAAKAERKKSKKDKEKKRKDGGTVDEAQAAKKGKTVAPPPEDNGGNDSDNSI